MRNLLWTGCSPIGLDVGRRTIKAIQLGRVRGGRGVIASAYIGRSTPDAPMDQAGCMRLSRVLSQQGFVGRKIVLAVPAENLMTAVLDMPPRESGAPYEQIVYQEFGRLQGQDPGGFEVAWWEVPRPARASSASVMTVGCAHADADPLLSTFVSGGYDVVAMDYGLCAAVRACRHQVGTDDAISAVLDMGWGSARLAIVHQSAVVFDRTLADSGMGALQGRVCETLGVEPAEADCLLENVGLAGPDGGDTADGGRVQAVAPLLRQTIVGHLDEIAGELDASFEYASHQYPQAQRDRLILVGGGGAIPGVTEYLDSRIRPRVLCAQASGSPALTGQVHLPCKDPLMSVALGLAWYGEA